jgi:peroxiredoxin Q/BCP
MKIRANPLEVGDCFPMPVEVSPTAELTDRQKPLGRPVVLFFFVLGAQAEKASQEMIGFRDLYEEFQKLNATVLGATVANLDKLRALAQQHNLPFPLLADTQLKMSLAYGAVKPERVEESRQRFLSRRAPFCSIPIIAW